MQLKLPTAVKKEAQPGVISARMNANHDTPNDTGRAAASAMVGYYKNQMTTRGLHDNKLVDHTGGVVVRVGDGSIGRKSISLQPPQRMVLNKQGAIATRQQQRLDIDTRTVPAIVVSVETNDAGPQIQVVLAGEEVSTQPNAVTRQNEAANPFNALGRSAEELIQSGAVVRTVQMYGTAFAGSEEAGFRVPEVGQTISVSLSDQNEQRTIWFERNGRNVPKVVKYSRGESISAVNGITSCCESDGGGNPGGS